MPEHTPACAPRAWPGSPRVAIVYDWLEAPGGGERVLSELLALLPEADLYCAVDFLPEAHRGFLKGRAVRTSAAQRLPFAKRWFRHYLPLLTLAIEQLDLSGYDLVLSICHTLSKGVLTGPDQLHLCYLFSPARYAWDLQHQYLREAGLTRGIKGWLARLMLHRFRLWDLRSANGVDDFVAISGFIARRTQKVYRRPATVIYPPVDIEGYTPDGRERDPELYVTVSRLVAYKRVDLMIEAFRELPGRRLLVVGDGPEMARLRERARGLPNVALLGWQGREQVLGLLRSARAFVFAAEEDFGISPLEAQACGTPVVAYGRGGVRETICGLETREPTGVHFSEQSAAALLAAIRLLEAAPPISAAACRRNAERFSAEAFRAQFSGHVEQLLTAFMKSVR